MVQTTLDDIRKNDTAKLFRDDADILAIRPSSAPANNLRNGLSSILGQEEGKPKAFDPNGDSDAAILLRRSGYRQTDEKTREGVYHVDEARSETKIAERAAIQAAQAAASATFAQQARSWWNACTTGASRIANSIGDAVDSVTGYVSDKISSFSTAAGNVWNSVKSGAANIGANISSGFNTYIAKPVGEAVDWAADKANTYIVKPASSVMGYAQEKASNAWSATKSFFGYGDDDKPEAAKPASAPVAARPAAQAPAASQPLAGQKNNVSSGLSLSSAWDAAGSAVDSVSDWWNGPSAKAAPAPRR